MNNENDNEAQDDIGTLLQEAPPMLQRPRLYQVVLLNDNYTPMEFVVHVLQHFFGRTVDEATQIMLNVHQRGVGICGIYSFEIAETKASKTMEYARQKEHPLQLQLEKE